MQVAYVLLLIGTAGQRASRWAVPVHHISVRQADRGDAACTLSESDFQLLGVLPSPISRPMGVLLAGVFDDNVHWHQ